MKHLTILITAFILAASTQTFAYEPSLGDQSQGQFRPSDDDFETEEDMGEEEEPDETENGEGGNCANNVREAQQNGVLSQLQRLTGGRTWVTLRCGRRSISGGISGGKFVIAGRAVSICVDGNTVQFNGNGMNGSVTALGGGRYQVEANGFSGTCSGR